MDTQDTIIPMCVVMNGLVWENYAESMWGFERPFLKICGYDDHRIRQVLHVTWCMSMTNNYDWRYYV